MPSFTDINIEKYSERAIVVRGEIGNYKDDLLNIGGKFNDRLRGGAGYIFPKTKENNVKKFINDGKHVTIPIITQQTNYVKSNTNDYKKLCDKIDKLEKTVNGLKKLMVTFINNKPNEPDIDSDSEDSDNSEEFPRKRLLR